MSSVPNPIAPRTTGRKIMISATPDFIFWIDNWRRLQPEPPPRSTAMAMLASQALELLKVPKTKGFVAEESSK